MFKTLIINSYGGSLNIAAHEARCEILGSLEDKGYGIDTQKLNFPEVTYYDTRDEWPLDINLRDAVVIAHPPCSAFSAQNKSKNSRKVGLDAGAFTCTKSILDYVLPRRPRVVLIESVTGALEGAKTVHDHYARVYNYVPYRFLVNSASFGVPQWRKRFWILLVDRDAAREAGFQVKLRHNVRHVGEVLDASNLDTEMLSHQIKNWEVQKGYFEKLGLNEEAYTKLLTEDCGSLIRVLGRKYNLAKPWWQIEESKKFIADHMVAWKFTSHAPFVLSPTNFAHVLLAGSFWFYGGRPIGLRDYKMLMGFPADYKFHSTKMTMELLSRGITPPVGTWFLKQIGSNYYNFNLPEEKLDIDDVCPPHEVLNLNTPSSYNKMEA